MIEKLPPPTRAKLRSTQILTTLPQIVSELLQNSLDAGAQTIEIGVNCEEWTCWVKDDGSGISKEGLLLLSQGSEEGRYITSKEHASDALNALQTFGFRGEALPSAADLCCLEISSRTRNSRETWAIITKGGKCLYSGPAIRWRRETPGTVVCIRDAFYNLPVRRRSHPPATRTIELIRREMEAYALVFSSVSFTLENTQHSQELQVKDGIRYKIPKTASSVASFRSTYGRALAEYTDEIKAESGPIKIHGFISLVGAHSKLYQFLYINRHPVAPCELHRVIDSRFASSTFSKNAFDEQGEMDLSRSDERRSPRKMEKKPVYVLNITVPPDQVDNCLEPAKTSVHIENKTNVASLLSSSVQDFLVRNGFAQVRQEGKGGLGFPLSPHKRRKLNFEGDSGYVEFDGGDPGYDDRGRPPQQPIVPINVPLADDEMTWSDRNTGQSFVVNRRTGNSYSHKGHGQSTQSGRIPLNLSGSRRTIPQKNSTISEARADNSVPQWIISALQSNQNFAPSEKVIPSVTQSFGNEKESFGKRGCNSCQGSRPLAIPCHDFRTRFENLDSPSLRRRFKKGDLGQAVVINQVDCKFIACVISSQLPNEADSTDAHSEAPLESQQRRTSQTIVLVDQHAADERVRVEQFLKDLCLGFLHSRDDGSDSTKCVPIKELSPPRLVLLSRHEVQHLSSSTEMQAAFRHWGIRFGPLDGLSYTNPISGRDEEESPDGNDTGYYQVQVESIPEIVSEKLMTGDELRDLVKGFIGQLEIEMNKSHHHPSYPDAQPDDEFYWLTALRWCPRGLLALINSKACRGAIMFNDSLTHDQCERLIRQLSQTAFPFQCAHGRPSLVPAVDLTTLSTDSESWEQCSNQIAWQELEKLSI